MKICSFFSGAGGFDLGFHKAGFDIIWANEYDKSIWDTFTSNFPNVILNKKDIRNIHYSEIPDCDGIIGGPPCQSWSIAGANRGIIDARGKLFWDYIHIIKHKYPLFFIAENVSGLLSIKHKKAFEDIIQAFSNIGYNVSYQLINTRDYNIPQDRQRVFIIGFRNDISTKFIFPNKLYKSRVLKDVLIDLPFDIPLSLYSNKDLVIPNHESLAGTFSTIYMSRNRVRSYDEPSFTIQASGRHAPLHPIAPKMLYLEADKRCFVPGKEYLYRRLSVRECARIQTFPDTFIFYYKNINDGYKMVGNAVPVDMAYIIASEIKKQLKTNLTKA